MVWVKQSLMVAGLALVFLCAGCEDKFSRQRYEMVCVGLSADEVARTLGLPDAKYSNGTEWLYVRQEPYQRAKIFFGDGKVCAKEWSDEKTFFEGGEDDCYLQPSGVKPCK